MTRVLVGFFGEVVVTYDEAETSETWPERDPRVVLRETIEAALLDHKVRVSEIRWWVSEP